MFSIPLFLGRLSGLVKKSNWSIGIVSGESPYSFSQAAIINPVLTASDVTDTEALFLADPFMLKEGGLWHMFFELLERKTRKGVIGWAQSRDGFRWEYGGKVLEEDFHLSYPYVFRWEEGIYMVPEASRMDSVRLYRAARFPGRWKFVKELLTGRDYVDNSIFRYHGGWWMLNSNRASDTLRLFHSDELEGPWQEHPKSPVIKGDKMTARPAGRVVEHEGRLIRFAQDDSKKYGKRIFAFEITRLSETDYEERFLGEPVKKPFFGWNSSRVHNIDLHPMEDGRWLASLDGKGYRWAFQRARR